MVGELFCFHKPPVSKKNLNGSSPRSGLYFMRIVLVMFSILQNLQWRVDELAQSGINVTFNGERGARLTKLPVNFITFLNESFLNVQLLSLHKFDIYVIAQERTLQLCALGRLGCSAYVF